MSEHLSQQYYIPVVRELSILVVCYIETPYLYFTISALEIRKPLLGSLMYNITLFDKANTVDSSRNLGDFLIHVLVLFHL